MPIYKNEAGEILTVEQARAGADASGMTVEQYTSSLGYTLTEEEESVVDPGKEMGAATMGAGAGPMREPKASEGMGFVLENTLSGSPLSDSAETPTEFNYSIDGKSVTKEEYDKYTQFQNSEMGEKIQKARAALNGIIISPEKKKEILSLADTPIENIERELQYNAKFDKMMPTGDIINTTYTSRYADFIEQAKTDIASSPDNNYDIYSVPQDQWKEKAKELYVKQQEELEMRRKAEEILEEYEKDVFGSWFSFARIKKLASKGGPVPIPTDEEIEYAAGRAILTAEFKGKNQTATNDYNSAVKTINTFNGILETNAVELVDLEYKFNNDPGSITGVEKERYNELVEAQKTAYGVYEQAFNKLNKMEGASDKLGILADMTIRTYNNTEVAVNRITGATVRAVAGLGSVAYEFSPQQLIKRTTGYDINKEGGYLPMFLAGIAPGTQFAGSDKFKKGVDYLYDEVEKIENATKAKQQLGEVKSIEDFGEFMLDLFSEQAVNTAITVGTGGAGLIAISASASGNKFHEMDLEMQHDPDLKISALQFYSSGILYGGAEYITERVSLGQARGALKYFGFGKNNFKKAAKGTFDIADDYALKPFNLLDSAKKYGINVNKEGGAEFFAQLINNGTDKYVLNKDVAITDGLGEAYLTGSIMSGFGFQAPVLAGDVYRAFNGDGEISKITNRTKRLFDIRKQMTTISNNMPKEGNAQAEQTLNMLQEEADNLIIENLKSKKLAENRIDELTNNDKRALLDIDAAVYKFKKGIEAANNNTNLNADQKLNFISKFKQKIDAANTFKNSIIANSANSAAKAKQKKVQIKLAAEKDLNFTAVNVTTQEQALEEGNRIINESNLEASDKKKLRAQLQEGVDAGDVNGYYIGAEVGLPLSFTIENNLVRSGLGATVLHETGHATFFKKLLQGNADVIGLTNSFETYMIKNFKGAKEKFAEVEKKYPKDKFTPAEIAEEKLATMLEYVYNVDMNSDRTFSKKVVDQYRKIVGTKETESIETGQDVFRALQSFSRTFDTGEVTGLAEKVLKGNIKIAQTAAKEQAKKSSVTFSLNSAKENLGKVAVENLKGAAAQTDIAIELPGMAKAQIAKLYNLKPQQLNDFTDAVVEKMYLGQETTRWNGKGQLYGFLNGRISFRIKDIVKEEYNRPQQERMYLSNIDNLQASEQKALSADPIVAETTVKEKPRYKNLIQSKALPAEAANSVKSKVLSTVRVLKSKIDAAVSKNRTVTPLVAEIKKQIGKQADIEFKKALGNKKDGQLRRNYLKFKKPILENMTTTWLMQSMPFAVQKQVDGKFTSDWQGKKIDRESVNTDKAGRTSGAEITRRFPNAANKITDEQFLSYLFKGNEVIRGRKEALAKAMAEEYSFDLFTEELNNPESDIRVAFEANQERLGVELFDNYVAEVSRQVERGNVKFSKNIQEKNYQKAAGRLFREAQKRGIDNVIDENGDIVLDPKDYNKFPKIGALVRSAFDDGLVTDAPVVQFLQGIKKSDVVPDFVKEIAGKALSRKTSTKKQLDAFAKDMTTLGKELGSTVTDIIGFDGFGFYNRLLDSAAAKEDGTSGPYFNTLSNLKNSQKESQNLPLNFDAAQVSPMNSKIGVMGKIGRILNSEKTAAQKIEDYSKFIVEIEEANYQNKILAKHIIKTAIKLVNNGKITPASYVQMLQAQTNAVKGLRGLTGLKYITFKDGPQGNIKGEHLADNAGSMLEFAELAFENLTEIELDYKIDRILEFHDQWLETRETLDFVDAFGKNNPFKDRRILLLPKVDQAYVYTYDLRPASELIEERSEAIKFSRNIDIKKYSDVVTGQKAIDNANKKDYAINPKGISVWDFDDTLARTKSSVIVNMPLLKPDSEMADVVARRLFKKEFENKPSYQQNFKNLTEEQKLKVLQEIPGKTKKIDAAEFAAQSEMLAAQGATFDFSEFSKVMQGTKGPMFEKALKRNKKFGNDNVYILTARPANSKYAIHRFLKGIGLDIKLENIFGLADGNPKAKANWVISKVAEGYNDFYFADDHMGNVKAVKDVLDNFDVKGKVQQAKIKFSANLDKGFNDMIERQTGVESFKEFSTTVARRRGKYKGRAKFFIPPSAEDFRGLTQYIFAGKGKQGDADQAFFEQALMDPYFKGVAAMERARQTIKNSTKALLKQFKPVKKKLNKLIPDGDYTHDAAIRIYLWDKAGYDIPGISKRDRSKLSALVANDPQLKGYADGLLLISQKDKWSEPGEYWDSQTTLSDLNNLTEKVNRKEYLTEFIQNVDEIFSEKNLNKIEALYGSKTRAALEDSIVAMKTGSNRSQGKNKITNAWLNWVNNSVGTIMFFNRRSALLQTISSINFINWSDNNPLKAGLAFANQPQYWKDFSMLFNSDKLKQRRGGLKSDVQEQEIANAAKNTKDKANAVVSYLLKIGFTPTQIADSFAIAAGGATMYRNRVNTYLKEGMSQKDAEAKAFLDFSKISDESQQSGDPALVSQQQRSVAGRLILAFQNTPMQYTRLMKKAGQDLINGRGNPGTNISKIVYYGAIQNIIFTALQNAAFALIPGFDDEEEDDETRQEAQDKKAARMINGMTDTILRGTGIYGAVASTLKNTYMKYVEQEKKGYRADHAYTLIEAANISPPIGSKFRKIYGAIQTNKFDKDVIEKHPWDVTIDGKFNLSPTYSIIGNLSSAALNIPLDRAMMEARSIAEALDARNTAMQRLALGLGWRTWDVNAKNEEFELIKTGAKATRKEEGKRKAKETRRKNTLKKNIEKAKAKQEYFNEYYRVQDSIMMSKQK